MKSAVKIVTIILLGLLLAINSFSRDYFFDTSGEKVVFDGTFTKGDKTLNFTETLEVIDPAMVNDNQFNIIHYIVIHSDLFNSQKVSFYDRKDDGIYLVATADAPGQAIKKLETPSMEIPLPLKLGVKWHKTRIEGGSLVEMDFEIVSLEEKMMLNGKEQTGTLIKATGSAVNAGVNFKIEKRIFWTTKGRVWQSTKKYIPSGEKSVSTISYNRTIEPAPPVETSESIPEAKGETHN